MFVSKKIEKPKRICPECDRETMIPFSVCPTCKEGKEGYKIKWVCTSCNGAIFSKKGLENAK